MNYTSANADAHLVLPKFLWLLPVVGSIALSSFLFCIFRRSINGRFVYFDPQDTNHNGPSPGRRLPLSAKDDRFRPLLKHYIGVTQLVITISAASIAFGGEHAVSKATYIAKVFLACSMALGIVFCALLLYRYDEYAQDVESYTRDWYAGVQACGFGCLLTFLIGFLIWAVGLT